MQTPSAQEIEREVAALRDIRRRSTQAGPGALPLDPDLPPNGPGGSASAGGYWDNYSGPPQRRPSARLRQQAPDDTNTSQEGDDVPDDPSHLFWMDDIPSTVDEADEPIIVPRPGQILRRTARTKIRKTGLAGDGGGHRFGPSRRGGRGAAKADTELASDSGHESASEHRHSVDKSYEQNDRPLSYADEAFILDAYADRRDSMISASSSLEDDDLASSQSHSTAPTSAPQSKSHEGSGQRPISPPATTTTDSTLSPPRGQPTVRRISPQPEERQQPQYQPEPQHHPQLHHPTPQRHGHLEVPGHQAPNRSPSPGSASDVGAGRTGQQPSVSPEPYRRSPSAPPQTGAVDSSPSPYAPSTHSPAPSIKSTKSDKGREKEKKGLLKGMWGGEKEKKKEKDSGFFGSLFGSGKKKQDEPEKGGLLSGAGPAAAAALLGASKSSKNQMRPPSPNLTNNYSRYPIHVERAVYRLSHIKLANPRRPLYEQVLISNLMFWYLGVINKVTPPTPAANNNQPTNGTQNANGGEGAGEDKEKTDRDRQEREQAEMEEKERMEHDRLEREQREREMREKEQRERAEREGKKRGTLVKNVTPPGGQQRRAEMPVRGPQYDVQHRIMEQEQGNAGPPYGRGPPPMGRGPGPGEPYRAGPDGSYGPPRGGGPPYPQQRGPPYPQQYPPNQGFNQQQQGNYQPYQPSLPPGAMAPSPNASPEQWLGSATNSRESPYAAASVGPNRSRSPPQQQKSPPPQGVGRSASANVGGPPPNYGRPSSAGGPVGGGQWGPPQQQRRGPSPQPPMSAAAQQQQQQQQQYRGGPVVR
ncbi:hypothetical protein FRB90_009331 [Tulasnella sp. 427]|nr:hypothetical protein FRB90_009331 [Tulasnella sp. 427]